MPCPVFRPTRVVDERIYTNGRLPLIDEYEGICTAPGGSLAPDRETLFRCCNHGYSHGACSRLPSQAKFSCMRYSVLSRTPHSLHIICVEEINHEPRQWHRLEYLIDQADLRLDLQGCPPTECVRAQAVAFCRAYVRHAL